MKFLSDDVNTKHMYKRFLKGFLVYVFSLCLFATDAYSQTNITGTLVINDGGSVTNERTGRVTLSINAIGAKDMMISNDGSYIGRRWQPYEKRVANWKLSEGDGMKTVYVKFRDGNGNVSEDIIAMIELDRVAPLEPSIMVLGSSLINSPDRKVNLEVSAIEAEQMQISNRPDFLSSGWVKYQSLIRGWTLSPGDGKKTIFARFRDQAGNVTETVSIDVVLDMAPPSGVSVKINNNDKYTTSHKVVLNVFADGATEMIIRGGDGWVPYQTTYDWELTPGDGLKTVYVKFKDDAGNTSPVVYDQIIVDTGRPKNASILINNGVKYIRKYNEIGMRILVQDAHEMMISNNEDFAGAKWVPYTPIVSAWAVDDVDGKKTIYFKFRNAAGNESEVYKETIILDKTPPTNPFIKIASKNSLFDEATNKTIASNESMSVDLEINCDGADYMMISDVGSFYGAKWERYQTKFTDWKLSGSTDGQRQVFVRFRDKAGNVSEVANDKIVIDTEPPVDGQLLIDNNAEFCTDPDKKVKLKIFARGATEMIVGNDPIFSDGQWEKYATEKDWVLAGEDGLKSVIVKFRDQAGNESTPAMDNIMLDRKPPFNNHLLVNKGEKNTNDPDRVVIIKPTSTDAVAMQISNEPEFKNTRWIGYASTNMRWQLSDGDGEKMVYARFRDQAGNISETVSDDILLDRTPPKIGRVAINEGDRITNNANAKVTLNLFAEGAVEMRISNNYDFRGAEWVPYAETKEWLLEGPDGLKTVYVQFRDKIGNPTKTAYTQIGVDRNPPKQPVIKINDGAAYCTNINGLVDLKLQAIEAREMSISNSPDFSGSQWVKYEYFVAGWKLDGDDGEKKVYVKFRDQAKNETTPVLASIILDRQEPFGEFIQVNNGDKFTNDKSQTVNVEVKAEGADEMMISPAPNFRPGKWEPYKEKFTFPLYGRDGEKTLFVKFRDKAGNESGVVKASITLDTEAPIATLLRINDGKTATESSKVKLEIRAKNAAFMMLSNEPNFSDGIWEPYAEFKEWYLKEGEGIKRVHVKFKDEAQNESAPRITEITLYSNYR